MVKILGASIHLHVIFFWSKDQLTLFCRKWKLSSPRSFRMRTCTCLFLRFGVQLPMDPEIKVSGVGAGFRGSAQVGRGEAPTFVAGFGFSVSGFRFSGSCFRVSGFDFGFPVFGFRVPGFGLRTGLAGLYPPIAPTIAPHAALPPMRESVDCL